MKPWVKKYQPKELLDIRGQDTALKQLKESIANFKKTKKATLIYGPTGSGKTATAHALAKELDLEIIEVNASDTRNKEEINSLIGSAATQMSLFNKGKIILIDEVDGLSGTKDRGGISAITKIIEKSAFPIILTANDPWDSKFSTLRKKANLIQFHTLNYLSVFAVLKKICTSESIKYDESTLKSMARMAGGDLRGAINDLQMTCQDKKTLLKEDIEQTSQRNKTQSMISALMKIFKTMDPKIALTAFDDVQEDFNKRFLWLDENIPKEYTKPKNLASAYDKLSKADVFQGRIRRWQHWRFLSHINALLTAGVALSKDEKYKQFIKYTPTKRILKLWRANMTYQKRKSIAVKIAEKTHTSLKQSIKNMPYIQTIFKKNKQMAEEIIQEFELDSQEVDWLKK